MARSLRKASTARADSLLFDERGYGDFRRKQLTRLFFTYLAPLLILLVYFSYQYHQLASDSWRLHLTAIAENQANTFNLFLTERVVNLNNVIDDPEFRNSNSTEALQRYLQGLKRVSETFVDLGFFSSSGVQVSYAGPYPSLENRDYGAERWFTELKESNEKFIITDIYLGFRQRPHFTIAVSRDFDDGYAVLRATLDPEKIYDYMSSLEGASEVSISIVNNDGYYQLVTPHIGTPLEASSFVPPIEPALGAQEIKIGRSSFHYAYSWIRMADWALIVQPSLQSQPDSFFSGPQQRLFLIAIPLVLLLTWTIFNRANKLVALQMETDRTRLQLEHAAKLASVGELAAGIAHEINNPLAVINEEAGLVKDLMNPELGPPASTEELVSHLDTISRSVFRCRDITHKLLGFVRKDEVELRSYDLGKVIDGVVDGLLGKRPAVSNIEIVRDYGGRISEIETDANQLQQVLLNIINNAIDALEGKPGRIVIRTFARAKKVCIAISDSGMGIAAEQMSNIFMPFFTTKEVGKGTGLGLSVSYGIVKNLGGDIEVESSVGEGSTFTIVLPMH